MQIYLASDSDIFSGMLPAFSFSFTSHVFCLRQ